MANDQTTSSAPQDVLEGRLDRARRDLFRAQGIVQAVVAAMRPADWPGSEPGYPFALEAVDEMLEAVGEAMASDMFFDPELSVEEADQQLTMGEGAQS